MIVAGFGFRTSATADSLRDALERARSGLALHAIATLSDKADCPEITSLSAALSLPIMPIDATEAAMMDTPTESAASQAARKIGSVAEATALAAAGPDAQLISARVISGDRQATCAVAASREPGASGEAT